MFRWGVILAVSLILLTATQSRSDSPFGLSEVRLNNPVEVEALADLGASMARLAPIGSLIWDMVERRPGVYDWEMSDKVITAANKAGAGVFMTVMPHSRLDRPEVGPGRGGLLAPRDMGRYQEFLRKAAERYDGDGVNDAPGSPRIAVIQIGNEFDVKFFWQDTPENYAVTLKKSYQAIKSAAPEIKVAMAGASSPEGFQRFFRSAMEELARLRDKPGDQYFDIFDFHWPSFSTPDDFYGVASVGGGRSDFREFVASVRGEMKRLGFQGVSVYITEMSDYTDSPSPFGGLTFPPRTERQQAARLVKRFIYGLANGADKIFWSQIIEQHNFGGHVNGYFDNAGLINNDKNPDGFFHKKLAYYSYRKMAELMKGVDVSSVQTVQESGGVHVYRFMKNGSPLWVAWKDGREEKRISLPLRKVRVTDAVPNFSSGKEASGLDKDFVVEVQSASEGDVSLFLKNIPVFITEEQ